MRRRMLIIGLMLLPAVGCSGMNNTEKGLLGGAAVGTGLGALVGRGNPAAMAVGAIAGTAVGGIAGSDQDRREDRRAYNQAVANAHAARQMSVNDVIQLSQRGIAESIIIQQIESTNSVFNLSNIDLIDLQNQNVSQNVIRVMQTRRYPGAVVVHQPVLVGPPVYGPPPPPPVSVGIGFSSGGRYR